MPGAQTPSAHDDQGGSRLGEQADSEEEEHDGQEGDAPPVVDVGHLADEIGTGEPDGEPHHDPQQHGCQEERLVLQPRPGPPPGGSDVHGGAHDGRRPVAVAGGRTGRVAAGWVGAGGGAVGLNRLRSGAVRVRAVGAGRRRSVGLR